MGFKLRYAQYNSCSILIEWPAVIDENMLKDILNFKNMIKNNNIKQEVDIISTYNSILVIYNIMIGNVNDEIFELKTLYESDNKAQDIEPIIWEIPVCYDDEFGVDIDAFSKFKNLTKTEIIQLHSETNYTVFFIGFLPGFLYLGGLDSKLFLDRKTTPALNVKKGSVAIGGKQTGIYPQDSPGGWHIIGNSPIELFNAKQDPPCFVKAGDKVKFNSISKSEYFKIQNDIENSIFDSKKFLFND
jgi:inhibitor of KinA